MGSRLRVPAGRRLRFRARTNQPGATLQLVTSGGRTVASAVGRLRLRRAARRSERWYFVRVVDAEGAAVAYSTDMEALAAGLDAPTPAGCTRYRDFNAMASRYVRIGASARREKPKRTFVLRDRGYISETDAEPLLKVRVWHNAARTRFVNRSRFRADAGWSMRCPF